MNFNEGDKVYKFTLIKKLGGNFGEVWHALDRTLDKEVALKILEPSFEPIAKLLDEARIGNKFNHKNLLPIFYADVSTINGKTYTLISQEYFKNGSVTNHLNTHNFLPLPQALKVLQDILFGLEYLHNSGFYHNDIKPGNILMDNQFNAVLADYGIAGFSPDNLPVIPKNSYKVHRAPESCASDPRISVHSDIYQVGCTAYRLLNGISNLRNEFNDLGPDVYEDKKAKGQIPDSKTYASYVPSSLKTIINKALNVDPTKRYSSALEMRRKLEKLCFSGYWTSDHTGAIGVGAKYIYRYSIVAKPNHLFDFRATKENISSGKITRVVEFDFKKISQKEIDKKQSEYVDWVVINAA